MKNLKDHLKLIFAAVMSFIVSLLPNKKMNENVPVDAIGNDVKESRAAGKKVCKAEDILVSVKHVKERIAGYWPFNRRQNQPGWKIHRYGSGIRQMTEVPGYYNTG